jgi:hypothetical protein
MSASLRADAAREILPSEYHTFEALPGPMRHALRDAGLAKELVDSGGINLTRLDAAAWKLKLTPEERIVIKVRTGQTRPASCRLEGRKLPNDR